MNFSKITEDSETVSAEDFIHLTQKTIETLRQVTKILREHNNYG